MKILFLFSLFIAAFAERILWDLGPNIELITMAMIVSLHFVGQKHSVVLTTLVLIVTDIILGTTNIFLFTWTGFLLPLIIFKYKKGNHSKLFSSINGLFYGLFVNSFFFIWTNFGVWLLDSWGMYQNNFSGLVNSYINALPFFANQLVSSIVFIPLGFVVVEVSRLIFSSLKPKLSPFFLPND